VKADTIIKWFMPKEERFKELLAQDTQNLVKAARIFAEIGRQEGTLEDHKLKAVELKGVEHEGDQITRRIFEALNSTFITPFDREDLRSLAMDLDDVLDSLEGVAQYIVLFELEQPDEALKQFADILVEMVIEIDRGIGLIWNLANEKQIQESIVRISELENRGDSLYNTVLAGLFKSATRNPVEIIKWKVVYDGLEEACDQCKDLTHVLGNIVLKHA
jgi:predicted phosphate transport protein (TIGR00153 family)